MASGLSVAESYSKRKSDGSRMGAVLDESGPLVESRLSRLLKLGMPTFGPTLGRLVVASPFTSKDGWLPLTLGLPLRSWSVIALRSLGSCCGLSSANTFSSVLLGSTFGLSWIIVLTLSGAAMTVSACCIIFSKLGLVSPGIWMSVTSGFGLVGTLWTGSFWSSSVLGSIVACLIWNARGGCRISFNGAKPSNRVTCSI